MTWPHPTPLHRLRAGPKLLVLLLFTAAVMMIDRPAVLMGGLAVTLALYALCGGRFLRGGLRVLRPVLPLLAVILLWHLWLGAAQAGAVMVLRFATAILAANLVTMTSRLDALTGVLAWVAAPLRHLGLPPATLAMAVALMIRTVPVTADRHARLADAWRARAAGTPRWRVVTPTLLGALDDSERLAEALRARGGLS
nr:energy-coupling factor transporter transmembrane component T [Falsirhodobacter halotolerans]